MRTTKTLILSAAALAAGLAAASAQVYSANVVGYINLTMTPGYNLFCNQLTNGNNSLNVAFVNGAVEGMQVMTLTTNATGGYKFDDADQYYEGYGWYMADGVTPSTRVLVPGRGYLCNNQTSTNVTITLVGDVPQGTIATAITGGNGFYGTPFPVVSGLSTNGFPQVEGMQYATFTGYPPPAKYSSFDQYYEGYGWYKADGVTPTDPAPNVGQGFLINNQGGNSTNWIMTFTVR